MLHYFAAKIGGAVMRRLFATSGAKTTVHDAAIAGRLMRPAIRVFMRATSYALPGFRNLPPRRSCGETDDDA